MCTQRSSSKRRTPSRSSKVSRTSSGKKLRFSLSGLDDEDDDDVPPPPVSDAEEEAAAEDVEDDDEESYTAPTTYL